MRAPPLTNSAPATHSSATRHSARPLTIVRGRSEKTDTKTDTSVSVFDYGEKPSMYVSKTYMYASEKNLF